MEEAHWPSTVRPRAGSATAAGVAWAGLSSGCARAAFYTGSLLALCLQPCQLSLPLTANL